MASTSPPGSRPSPSPASVCISHTVYEQVKNKLDLDYRPLGSHRVKNIAEPVRAYEVGGRGRGISAETKALAHGCRRGVAAIVSAGLVAWALHAGGGRDLLGLGSAAKPVDVASLAAPARLAGRPSVAVLPFKNLSGDAGHDFFSDGITEDVITALGRFSNLLVISKSATFPFKNSNASPAEIGRLLDARYLLDGSIRRAGNRVRVGVALTEPTTGRNVWSETYDVEGDDIFAVQDNIAKRVVGAAAVKLTRFEQERVLAKPTSNLAAYEYVLRGRDAFSHDTRDSNDEASELFQRAIDLDPNYADAYAALGYSHYEAVISGWSEFRAEELARAEALAQKALALDPATTRAYRVLAQLHLFRKRFDLALAQVDRALEINPSDADNYAARGGILVWAGKAAEALPWLEGALRFDQADGFAAARLCMAYYLLRRYPRGPRCRRPCPFPQPGTQHPDAHASDACGRLCRTGPTAGCRAGARHHRAFMATPRCPDVRRSIRHGRGARPYARRAEEGRISLTCGERHLQTGIRRAADAAGQMADSSGFPVIASSHPPAADPPALDETSRQRHGRACPGHL